MRRLFIFSLVLVVTMGMVYSQSLNVTSPSGGMWYKGTNHNITWTSSGCSSPNVKINIYKNSVSVPNFIEQLTGPNSGTKNWTVPMGYTNGTYIIRIKTDPAETGCLGDSAAFTITDAPGPTTGSINITHPTLNEVFCRGETETISWTSSGTLDANLKINIYKTSIVPANFVVQLTATTASGSKGWAVPSGAVIGDYYLRIKTNDEEVIVDSPKFKVEDCGDGGGDGPSIDWDRLKDLLRKLQRIPWWRNPKGPWPGPGPGPCLSCPVFDLGKLRELLAKAGLKEEIGIALYNGGVKIAEFGKFGPKSRLGRKGLKLNKLGRMGVMQSKVGLRSIKVEHTKMLNKGTGFKLVFLNSKGAIIGDFGIKLEEKLLR